MPHPPYPTPANSQQNPPQRRRLGKQILWETFRDVWGGLRMSVYLAFSFPLLFNKISTSLLGSKLVESNWYSTSFLHTSPIFTSLPYPHSTCPVILIIFSMQQAHFHFYLSQFYFESNFACLP